MTDDAYLKEPRLYEVDDYYNELFSLRTTIAARLQKMEISKGYDEELIDFWARVPDESFHRAMKDRRYKVLTIEERFTPETEPYPEEYGDMVTGWKAQSPLRMARSRGLVETLNTTEEPAEFKLAFYELYTLLQRGDEPNHATLRAIVEDTSQRPSDPYADEPLIELIKDYYNEVTGICLAIEMGLRAKGIIRGPGETLYNFWAAIDDETFRAVMMDVRTEYEMRTIEERFAADSPQALTDEVPEWIANSPRRVKRSNELVHILNTTLSPLEFKAAFHEFGRVMRNVTAAEETPAAALRATLGEGPAQNSIVSPDTP